MAGYEVCGAGQEKDLNIRSSVRNVNPRVALLRADVNVPSEVKKTKKKGKFLARLLTFI